jgi:methylphosphotriester-DNA--protein-cysteine methyltransferase
MITDKLKLLAQLKAQTAKLEASLETQRPAALAALPAEYGFDSLAAFVKALKRSANAKPRAKRGRKPGRPAKAAKPAKGKRAKLTDEIRAAVKAALEQGRKPKAIAKEVGISPASVNVLKKAFGMTKPRTAAAAPAATAPAPAPMG